MKVLYEILVPTMYHFPEVKPIRTAHHKNWDKEVIKITGGMTLMKPAEGRWVDKGELYPERVIPVRIMCDEGYIGKIISLTLKHYRQKAVMYYVVSREVRVITIPPLVLQARADEINKRIKAKI